MIRYNIIATGSTGNAVKINDILIDCGVSFKKLKDVYKHIKLVLLTHEHSDHFRPSTIRKLAAERPTLRFGCCRWMVPKLIECGVSPTQIDVYDIGKRYDYKVFALSPIKLYHDVPNCGYRLYFGRKRVRAMNEHLSQEEAEDFIYSNMTSKSRYIFLHEHIDK